MFDFLQSPKIKRFTCGMVAALFLALQAPLGVMGSQRVSALESDPTTPSNSVNTETETPAPESNPIEPEVAATESTVTPQPNWVPCPNTVASTNSNCPATGSLRVDKKVDTNGDGTFEGGNVAANLLGFRWGYDATAPARLMGTTASDVPVGAHTVIENTVNGYVFVGWYYGSTIADPGKSCNNPNGTSLPANVEVKEDKLTHIIFCNKKVITPPTPGSITIVKDARPNDGQDFTFTSTAVTTVNPGLGTFKLDDDNDVTLSNQKQFGDLRPGMYRVTEQSVQGWELKNIVCSEGSNVTVVGRTVTITLASGQDVICKFTNLKLGTIQVTKQTIPDGDPTGFKIKAHGAETLADDAVRIIHDDETVTYHVRQGTYSVTEEVPSGWLMTKNTCANLVVSEQDLTAECEIVNMKAATLTIVKDTKPNDAQDFTFTSTPTLGNPSLGTFMLDDDSDPTLPNQKQFTGLRPGSYNVTEQAVAGWTLESILCSSGALKTVTGNKLTVILLPGADVTCTFTNAKLSTITGVKFEDVNGNGVRDAGEPGLGGWTITISTTCNSGNNLLTTLLATSGCWGDFAPTTQTASDGTYSFNGVKPGKYIVCEKLQDGWKQTFPATLSGCQEVLVGHGQTVVANFGNQRVGGQGGGQVLGVTTTVQPALVDTGSSILASMFASLTLLGMLGAVTYASKKQYS